MKNHTIYLALFGTILSLCIFTTSFITTVHSTALTEEPDNHHFQQTSLPDMLIFLSPQYAEDEHIYQAALEYTVAVHNDVSWESTIISLTKDTNEWTTIDHQIETSYHNHPLKACLMIGEDISTPLAGDTDYMEKPSIMPWSTIGEQHAYDLSNQGIICQPYTLSLCIGLLYPTSTLSFEEKKTCIITTLSKFCDRTQPITTNEITVLESSDLNTHSQELYYSLASSSTLHYLQDSSDETIEQSLHSTSSVYMIHGHSNPAGTDLNPQAEEGWFSANKIDQMSSPVFCADGCYVNGWWSNQQDNNQLDPSIDATWYGSKIFTSTNIHALILGLLSQNGYASPVSFVEQAIPELIKGSTLADSIIGDTYVDSFIIYGDPSFHL